MTVDEAVRALAGVEERFEFLVRLYDYEGCPERELVPNFRRYRVELGRQREELATKYHPDSTLTPEVEKSLEEFFSGFESSEFNAHMTSDAWRDPRYVERTEGWKKIWFDYRRIVRWCREGSEAQGRGALIVRDIGRPFVDSGDYSETHFFERVEYAPILESGHLSTELEGLQVPPDALQRTQEEYDSRREHIVLVIREAASGSGTETYPYNIHPDLEIGPTGFRDAEIQLEGDFREGMWTVRVDAIQPALGYRFAAAGKS